MWVQESWRNQRPRRWSNLEMGIKTTI